SPEEIAVKTRSPSELQVCADGQVNVTFQSRFLMSVAVEEFKKNHRPRPAKLKELLRLDAAGAQAVLTEFPARGKSAAVHLLCVNGVESSDWREEAAFLKALSEHGVSVTVADPRWIGKQR